MTIRRNALGAALLALALGAAACGGDDSPSSSATTAPAATGAAGASTAAGGDPELCQQRDDLRASIKDLSNVDVLKNGTSALTAPVADIKEQAQAIASDAKGDVKPEAEALQSSLQKLEDALKGLGSGGGITSVVTSASAVVTSANTLLNSLDQLKC